MPCIVHISHTETNRSLCSLQRPHSKGQLYDADVPINIALVLHVALHLFCLLQMRQSTSHLFCMCLLFIVQGAPLAD